MSGNTIAPTSQSTAPRPNTPWPTSEVRYWSSKMIGSGGVASTVSAGFCARSGGGGSGSPVPKKACDCTSLSAGSRSASRPEPTPPARTDCSAVMPPLGKNAW